jgi:hypothetical protein
MGDVAQNCRNRASLGLFISSQPLENGNTVEVRFFVL